MDANRSEPRLMDVAHDAFLILDSDHVIRELGGRWEDLFSFDPTQMLGSLFLNYLHHSAKEAIAFLKHRDSQQEFCKTHALVRCSPESCKQLSLNMRYQANEKLLVVAAKDVSELVEAKRQVSQRLAALRVLNRILLHIGEAPDFTTALRETLKEICIEFRWPIGHVFYAKTSADRPLYLQSSGIWFGEDDARFEEFRRVTNIFEADAREMPLNPQWRVDVSRLKTFGRLPLAKSPLNVCAAFNMPIHINQRLVAVMEFFNSEAEEENPFLLEISYMISQHLGLLHEKILANAREAAAQQKNLEAAKDVQEALIAKDFVHENIEGVGFYRAATMVGGDCFGHYYDRLSNRMVIYIGDVTGHGVASALVSASVVGALESFMAVSFSGGEEVVGPWLSSLAKFANSAVFRTSEHSSHLMTMAFAVVDLKSGEVNYVNCGHCPAWLFSQGRVFFMGKPSPILGLKREAEFKVETRQLMPGDFFFLHTDGLFENIGPGGESVDKSELKERLMGCRGNARELKELVLTLSKSVWQQRTPDDDVTFAVVKWLGAGRR